jgi:hypothetical protein
MGALIQLNTFQSTPTTGKRHGRRLLLAAFIGMAGIFVANGVVPGAIEKFEDPTSETLAYLTSLTVLAVASILTAAVAHRRPALLVGLTGTALFAGTFNLIRPDDLTVAQPSLALASGLLLAVCLPGDRLVQVIRLTAIALSYLCLTLAAHHGWGSSVLRDWVALGLAGTASVVPTMCRSFANDRTQLDSNPLSISNSRNETATGT